MFSLFRPHRPSYQPRPAFGTTLILNGLLFILFSLLVFAAPELLAYIVAAFLLIVGVSLVAAGWRMRQY